MNIKEYKYYILKKNNSPSWRDEIWRCEGDKHWVWDNKKFYWLKFSQGPRYYDKDFYKKDISKAEAFALMV